MTTIEVKDLYKSFKIYSDKGNTLKERLLFKKRRVHENREVLKGISFSVEEGETVGLIGHNGCGKSTLLKLLTRILYPDQGIVKVKGRVSSLLELGAGFHPDLSGRENIYANAAIFGLKKKEIDTRLKTIIDFSELEAFIDNPVRTYSSGMYTRLAFSVAISVDADILLVDEILAVGDTNFQQKCLRKMRQLRDSGVTIVFVTHDVSTVKTFCSRAIWINDGMIHADGDSISTSDKYLSYMAMEQQKQLEKEDEQIGESEQAPPENQVAEQEGKSEEPSDENHFGNRDVIITKAIFTDQNGKETKNLIEGEMYSINMHYKVLKEGNKCNFGVGFFSLQDVQIFGTNMYLDNVFKDELPKEGCVKFVIDSFPLLTGEYKLSVAIINEDATPLDYYRNYLEFGVTSHSRAPGISNIIHRWELPK